MPKRMHFSRRRKGVTNYRKRLALLKSGLPRAVVRFTNAKVTVQITNFEGKGDRVLASASSMDLEKWVGKTQRQIYLPLIYLENWLLKTQLKLEYHLQS